MPKDPSIKKVLVIGSGPIIIGQAAEFDYSGTQACRALKSEGIEVVLVNSNPATIMTDPDIADRVYVEPMTLTVLRRIIEKEKPDSILPNLGGQTGLNLAMELARSGYLEQAGVRLLGAKPDTIDRAEDRQLFKDTMEKLGEPVIPSKVVESLSDALAFAGEIGYPVIVRPAFTMGGTGGGICETVEELHEIGTNGLRLSPIHQVLIEKCISGWKEIEYEVMRDGKGNVITVCNMENFDPVGVHTGDSIVVAPSQTLSDKEYQMLRTSALNIITELGIEGGCNCQFALKPDSFEYAVIEVNPRVSRSSALASKATGYPIAKVAAKIAIGYSLDEITNDVTGQTCACFEPALDYCVVKFPKWPFDKFVYAKKSLGTQMMATGEVMAIANSFEHAFMKAVQSIELGLETPTLETLSALTDEEVVEKLHVCDSDRSFVVYEAIKRGVSFETIYNITKIDPWFLAKLQGLAETELALAGLRGGILTEELYRTAKMQGFLDKTVLRLTGLDALPFEKLRASYKMVDTCAAEFQAQTPYFYATYDEHCDARNFPRTGRDTVIVLGSGPIRIGQGIEFDYSSVHCVQTLKELGYDVVIINNNPETVSTDYDTADRLYFEPLTPEDVMGVIEVEHPVGVVVAFGGQTAIKLTKFLDSRGIPILGTSAESIRKAEDRQGFKDTMESIGQPCVTSKVVESVDDAMAFAKEIGLPVIVRPAYTLGGTGGGIAYTMKDLHEIATNGIRLSRVGQVLIERCISGWKEIEYEVIRDGAGNVITVCNMENIDPVGVHTGDSVVVAPSQTLADKEYQMLRTAALDIISALKIEGGCNVQFALKPDSFEYAVIEVNPRVSRSSALASKATGYPIAKVAAKIALGYTLDEIKNSVTGKTCACFEPALDYCVVKIPKWPFDKFVTASRKLGTQMKATGEVMGIGRTLEECLLKSIRSLEIGVCHLYMPKFDTMSNEDMLSYIATSPDDRIYAIAQLIRNGVSLHEIFKATMITEYFLESFKKIVDYETTLAENVGNKEILTTAKKMGFSDQYIAKLWKQDEVAVYNLRKEMNLFPVYKMIETSGCGGYIPYFYSTYEKENDSRISDKKKIIVLGSGPIRIGFCVRWVIQNHRCIF